MSSSHPTVVNSNDLKQIPISRTSTLRIDPRMTTSEGYVDTPKSEPHGGRHNRSASYSGEHRPGVSHSGSLTPDPRLSPTHGHSSSGSGSNTPRTRPKAHSLTTQVTTPTGNSSRPGSGERKATPPDRLFTVDEGLSSEDDTKSEQTYTQTYFPFLLTAIKELDYDWFEILLGPQKYQAWLMFVRDQHQLELPSLTDFYQHILDFIQLYLDKERLERLYHSHVDQGGFTPLPTAGHSKSAFKEALQVVKQQVGLPKSAFQEENPILVEQAQDLKEPNRVSYRTAINQVHDDAIKAYDLKGILGYLEIMKKIEPQLMVYIQGGSRIDANFVNKREEKEVVLTDNQLTDFHKKLELFFGELVSKFLLKLKDTIETQVNIFSQIPTRNRDQKILESLYKHPWLAQYEQKLRKAYQEFLSLHFYSKYKKTNNLNQLKVLVQQTLARIPEVSILQKQTLTDYCRQAVRNYKNLETTCALTVRRRHPGKQAFSFISEMVDLFDSMRFDAFARICDENQNSLFHHLMASYRLAKPEDRIKFRPFVTLALKQGCHPYLLNKDNQDCFQYAEQMFQKARSGTVKGVGSQNDDIFPDPFILHEINEHLMPTFNPGEEEIRKILSKVANTIDVNTGTIFGFLFQDSEVRKQRVQDLTLLTKELFDAQETFSDIVLIYRIGYLMNLAIKRWRDQSQLVESLDTLCRQVGRIPGQGELIVFTSSNQGVMKETAQALRKEMSFLMCEAEPGRQRLDSELKLATTAKLMVDMAHNAERTPQVTPPKSLLLPGTVNEESQENHPLVTVDLSSAPLQSSVSNTDISRRHP